MEYKCSICGDKVEGELTKFVYHTEAHIIDAIKEKHPDWEEERGVCSKCLQYYKNQIKGTA